MSAHGQSFKQNVLMFYGLNSVPSPISSHSHLVTLHSAKTPHFSKFSYQSAVHNSKASGARIGMCKRAHPTYCHDWCMKLQYASCSTNFNHQSNDSKAEVWQTRHTTIRQTDRPISPSWKKNRLKKFRQREGAGGKLALTRGSG